MGGQLPEGWGWKRLGDVTTVGAGNSAPQGEQYFTDGTYPFVRTKDAGREKATICLVNTTDKVNNFAVKECKLKLLPAKTLIVPKSGMSTFLNHRALLGEPSYVSSHLATVIAGDDLLPEYLYFWSLTIDAKQLTHDINYPSLRLSELESTKIPLPPIETQRKIVAILEKADETKRLRMQADELTSQLLQSVFLEMFGNPVKNPKGWEIYKLQDVAEIRSGVTKGRKLSGKQVVSVPYLRVANVQDGYIDLNEIKTIEVLLSEVGKYALLEGDVLLTEGGDPDKLGRGAVLHNEIPNCIHQNHIFRVRVDKEYLVPEFLSMLIGSAYGKMYFLKSAKQTTGIATINSTQLKKFPVLVPPTGLQKKFAHIVEKVEAMRQNQKQSQQEIDNLFNALMQKSFKGELVA